MGGGGEQIPKLQRLQNQQHETEFPKGVAAFGRWEKEARTNSATKKNADTHLGVPFNPRKQCFQMSPSWR